MIWVDLLKVMETGEPANFRQAARLFFGKIMRVNEDFE